MEIRNLRTNLEKAQKKNFDLVQTVGTFKKSHDQVKDKNQKLRKKLEMVSRENQEIKQKFERTKKVTSTRLDSKLKEIEEEEFWKYEPTKYFSVFGKLDFHINISGEYSKFICPFKPERSKFQNAEDYEEMISACQFFENVVVDLEEDDELEEFVEHMKDEYQESVNEELLRKVDHVTNGLKDLLKDIIKDVYFFFMPSEDGEELRKLFELGSEKIRGMILGGIRAAQKKREEDGKGKNNVFLGELKGKIGYCRHRATLLKLICDVLGIRCKLEVIYSFHAWNTIQIKDCLFFVDVTIHGNRLFDMNQYYQVLENMIRGDEGRGRDKENTKNSLKELLCEKKRNEEILERLKRYTKKELEDEFRTEPTGRGGSGDVSLYRIMKDIKYSDWKNKEDEEEEGAQEEGEDDDKYSSSKKKKKKFGFMFLKGEVIAVKKIKVRDDSESEERGIPKRYAVREASHMKVLDHPSIIDVLGHWEVTSENCLYIAMRAMDMDGRRLLDKLTRSEEMTRNKKQIEVLFFLLETARGMRYLESLGISHLDLKLENVMVRWDSNKNEIIDVRIIDFGGAKNNCVHSSSFYMVTEGYDSPEIRDLKTVKEIQREIPVLKKMLERKRPPKRKIRELVNKIALKFGEIKRNFRGLDEHFEFVSKTIETFRLEDTVILNREIVRRRIEVYQILNKLDESENVSDFDCRADIYSFGVMMREFFRDKLVPGELVGLKEKCMMEDKRDRPSCDEIVHKLKKLLSFFNEKKKVIHKFYEKYDHQHALEVWIFFTFSVFSRQIRAILKEK